MHCLVMSQNSQADLLDSQQMIISIEVYLEQSEMEIKDLRQPTVIEYVKKSYMRDNGNPR